MWRAAFWIAFLVATILFLTPGNDLPPTGEQLVPHVDKLEHALVFAALAFLCLRAFRVSPWLVLGALAAYGALIEVIQTRIPFRSGDVWDWAADVVGAAGGLALVRWTRAPQP